MTQPNAPRSPDEPSDGERTTSDAAREAGQEVSRDAGQQAQAVAETTKQEASRVVDEAREQAMNLAEEAREQLRQQANQQTEHFGEALEGFSGRMHALADGRPEEAGALSDYADRIADQAGSVAGRIDELGFDGMVDEMQRYARRRPGAFLLAAGAAGFAMSRLARGARDAEQDGTTSSRGMGADTGGMQAGQASGPPPLPEPAREPAMSDPAMSDPTGAATGMPAPPPGQQQGAEQRMRR